MSTNIKMLFIFVALLTVAQGCFVSRSEGKLMQDDIKALKEDLDKTRKVLEADRKDFETQVKSLQQKSDDLENALENVKKTYGENVANYGLEQEKIIQKMMELNGKIDLGNYRLQLMEMDIKKIKESSPGFKAQKSSEALPDKMAEIKRPEKKKEYYNLAMKFFNESQWEASRVIFSEYLEKFKGDATAGKAQYFIAESYFKEGKFQNAVIEFQKVISEYNSCDKVEDAAYELALSFLKIGLADDAVKLLKEFVKAYPDSRFAPSARKKLAELKKGTGR